MREFTNQIIISSKLAELLEFCEVNCSAECCGINAFEINKALLLRKLIDKENKRTEWYNSIKNEVNKSYLKLKEMNIKNEEENIPVIYPKNDSSPEYYLSYEEILHLFKRLEIILKQVKGSNVLP